MVRSHMARWGYCLLLAFVALGCQCQSLVRVDGEPVIPVSTHQSALASCANVGKSFSTAFALHLPGISANARIHVSSGCDAVYLLEDGQEYSLKRISVFNPRTKMFHPDVLQGHSASVSPSPQSSALRNIHTPFSLRGRAIVSTKWGDSGSALRIISPTGKVQIIATGQIQTYTLGSHGRWLAVQMQREGTNPHPTQLYDLSQPKIKARFKVFESEAVSFAPDARYLVRHRNTKGGNELSIMSLKTGEWTILTNSGVVYLNRFLSFSWDSQYLFYQVLRAPIKQGTKEPGLSFDLWVFRPSTGEKKRLFANGRLLFPQSEGFQPFYYSFYLLPLFGTHRVAFVHANDKDEVMLSSVGVSLPQEARFLAGPLLRKREGNQTPFSFFTNVDGRALFYLKQDAGQLRLWQKSLIDSSTTPVAITTMEEGSYTRTSRSHLLYWEKADKGLQVKSWDIQSQKTSTLSLMIPPDSNGSLNRAKATFGFLGMSLLGERFFKLGAEGLQSSPSIAAKELVMFPLDGGQSMRVGNNIESFGSGDGHFLATTHIREKGKLYLQLQVIP